VDIRFQHRVTSIEYGKKSVLVSCEDQEGKKKSFKSKYCLCTFSLGVLKKKVVQFKVSVFLTQKKSLLILLFSQPSLPKWKLEAYKKMHFGVMNKVLLMFDEVFWEKGCWCMGFARYYYYLRSF